MDLVGWKQYIKPAVFLIVVAGVLILLSLFVYRFSVGYEVQGVPYSGIRGAAYQQFLYTNENSRVRAVQAGSASASLIMATGYWHIKDSSQTLVLPKDVRGKLPAFDTSHTLEDIAAYARELGFDTKIRRVPFGVWSLALYSNKSNPTPLIVEQDLSTQYPGEGKIFRVVIGVTPGGKEVIVHDYAYGSQWTIPRSDFEQLWRKPKRILVIEPKNRKVADAATDKFAYRDYDTDAAWTEGRTHWYLAEEARNDKDYKDAILHWEKIVDSPEFAESAILRQRYHLRSLLTMYLLNKQYQTIVDREQQAIAVNKPVGQIKEDVMIWVDLGEAYLQLGNKGKARSYAEKALAARAESPLAQSLLERASQ